MKMRLALLVLALSAVQSHAGIFTYGGSDSGVGAGQPRPNSDAAAAAFDAAVVPWGGLKLITFEALPTGFTTNLNLAPGVNLSTTGTANNPGAGIANGNSSADGFNTTVGGSQHFRFVPDNVTTATAKMTFTTPIQAFGAYVTGLGTAGGNLAINYSNGSSHSIPVAAGSADGVQFFGLTDFGASISSIELQLSSPRDIFGFDDIRLVEPPNGGAGAGPSAVPLPGAIWLGLAGAMMIARARRR